MSVYDVIYKTLSYTHPGVSTAEDMVEYITSKKGMDLERNFSLTLSSNNLETSFETHKIFHPENLLKTGHGGMG